MQHMAILSSDYPAVALPSLDSVTEPHIREAIEHLVNTNTLVREAHDVAGRLEAGHRIDELAPETIAEMVTVSRDAQNRLGAARANYVETLGKHRGQWTEDTAKSVTKARATVIKTATQLLEQIDGLEVQGGTLNALNANSPELKWTPLAETFELGQAQHALRILVDRLTEEQA